MKNFGIKIQNIKAKDGETGIISMGNSFIVMREHSNEDTGIWVENIEGIAITKCKVTRVGGLRYWLIRKLSRMNASPVSPGNTFVSEK